MAAVEHLSRRLSHQLRVLGEQGWPRAIFMRPFRSTKRMLSVSKRLAICVPLACWITAGCSSSSPFDYVPVSGRVTYEDGSPISGGCRLEFTALDAQPIGTAHPRVGLAVVNASGEFDCVTSYKYGDGLVPGKHKVVIRGATDQRGKPAVAKEYGTVQTTPLVIDTADVPLEIKIPKP